VKRAPLSETKKHLAAYVANIEQGPVVITRDGRPVAALVPIEDEDEAFRLAMAYSPRLREILEPSRDSIRRGQGIPHDEFWRAVEAEHEDGDSAATTG
jgi:prevent-host-death family protein